MCVNIRPIPFNLRDKMEEVVQKGLLDGVFEVAKGPTTWLLNPKLVPKPDGRVRFVLDCSPTNGAIRRTRYVLYMLSLQRGIVDIAHEGHQGVTKTKKLLRTKVWFPKLDAMVIQCVENCRECRIENPRVYYQPLQMSNMPNGPFEEVSTDFYGPTPSNTKLLVLIDDYSRFAIVREFGKRLIRSYLIYTTYSLHLESHAY